jgi:hypothetical protein
MPLARLSGALPGYLVHPHFPHPVRLRAVRPPAQAPRPADDPVFLHAGFAHLEPDLATEVSRGLGRPAASGTGDAS